MKTSKNIQHVDEKFKSILNAIYNADKYKTTEFLFGQGNSSEQFFNIMKNIDLKNISIQKKFVDFRM